MFENPAPVPNERHLYSTNRCSLCQEPNPEPTANEATAVEMLPESV